MASQRQSPTGSTGNTGAATFSPDSAMTCAALAAAPGRLEGIDPAGYRTGKFTDVPADARYAPYVNWAADKGIMGGTGETTFSPDSTVTREQMAVILEKYSKQIGHTLSKTLGTVTYANSAQASVNPIDRQA